jgi:hypothetical protein
MLEEYMAAAQHEYRSWGIAPELQHTGPLQREIKGLERARRNACRHGPAGWLGLQMINVAVWLGQRGAFVAAGSTGSESLP